jgi:multimeric flavodoxin WrbA
MKVIAVNGSPHHDGVIARGLEFMRAVLEKEGIETETIQAGRENIQGCIDCRKCRKTGKCAFDGDLVNRTAEMVNNADGLIIGSPVYYGSIAGNFKCFLDRLFFSGTRLDWKPAAALVSCRRSGGINAFHQMNNYLNLAGAVIVPSIYWGVIHGSSAEELMDDKEGIHIVETSARNMAWLMKTIALGKKEIPFPEKLKRPWTNFVR